MRRNFSNKAKQSHTRLHQRATKPGHFSTAYITTTVHNNPSITVHSVIVARFHGSSKTLNTRFLNIDEEGEHSGSLYTRNP